MRFKFTKYCSVLLILLALCPVVKAYASQFVDDNKSVRLRWKSGVIPIALSGSLTKQIQGAKSESSVVDAVKRSLNSWERVANVKFELTTIEKQSVGSSGKAGDGVNLITITPTPENLLLFNGGGEEISARTQTFYNGKGRITEADIVLNPYQQFSIDGALGTFDFESVLTHEIGHLLGLEHSFIPGATMFERQGKNGAYGLQSFAARTLAEDDITGIQAVYGAKNSATDCCGAIAGRFLSAYGKPLKDLQIWVEEAETARVAAGVLANSDGNFHIDGLAAGRYSIYAQSSGAEKAASVSRFVGETEVTRGKTVNVLRRLKISAKTFNLTHIGFNGQLSNLAIPLNGGKSFVVYVGGKNLEAEKLKVGFNSANLTIVADSLTKQEFGDEISVFSFEIKVNPQILPGDYTFFLRGANNETAYVAGGLTIDNIANP